MLVVDAQLGEHTIEVARLIDLEEFSIETPLQERVVDAEHDIGERRVLGQDCLAHHRASITALQQLNGNSCLGGERLEHTLTDDEGVVGHQCHRPAIGQLYLGAVVVAARRCEQGKNE